MSDDADFSRPTQDQIRTDLRDVLRGAVRTALEVLLEEEIRALVGARPWQRLVSRRDQRNGTYLRQVMTSLGHVELAIPRSRENGAAGAVLGRYQRRTDDIDAAIAESYVQGVSTRKMAAVTKALMGEEVGRSTVSRVTRTLEEQVEALRKEPISEPMAYVFLDGTFLDARWARRVENVAALVAYGVGPDGKRRLLGVTIGAVESKDTWTDLLRQLLDRGLHGVRLVIADAHEGIGAAVRELLPEVPLQRCTVHLTRNVLAKAPRRLWKRLGREVSRIFDAPALSEAKKRLASFRGGLGQQVPEALAVLDGGFAAATRFYAFPEAHWRRIRSTNGLERLHGEIKRRIRAVGAFPDRASALRLVTAVALRTATVWADRRYLDMSLLVESHHPKEPTQAA
jgi:transposase-like protein